jgi:putative hydrolase of HD superfamily
MGDLEKIFDFLHEVENLKSTLRYGITKKGRKESTAEHSWRLALMTFMIADKLNLDIDKFRAVKIALVHDIVEAVTGDIDSWDIERGAVLKKDKEENEKRAAIKLKNILPKEIGEEIYNLWLEYEEYKTKEAKFIKAMDKLETLTQFFEAGHKIYHDGIDHMAFYADKYVNDFPELMEMLKIIKRKLKSEFEKGGIPWKKEYDLKC